LEAFFAHTETLQENPTDGSLWVTQESVYGEQCGFAGGFGQIDVPRTVERIE
jgi:hypothetical protein